MRASCRTQPRTPISRAGTLPALAVILALAGCAARRPLDAPQALAGAERVTFPSRDGAIPLVGWVFRPAGAGPFPAVVALHGCGGLYGKRGDLTARHREWAERLARSGYLVLLPDSFTPRGLREICTLRDRPVRPERERSADAYGALAYLQARPDVRGDRVALLGWSNGGSAVLATVGADAPARPAGAAPDFRTAIAFYPGCNWALGRAGWLPLAAPLHVLSGGADDWTPAAPCRALAERGAAAGAPIDLVVYDGAYHDFDAPDLSPRVVLGVSTPDGTAVIGTHEPARAAALARVDAILRRALRDRE